VPSTTILSSAVNANFADIATGLSDCLTRDGQAGMSAVFKAVTGSATAPSITFTADPTTGLYLVSAGSLGITSNSLNVLTFTTAGDAQFAQMVQATEAARAKLFCVVDTADASTSVNINSLATSGTGAIAIGTSTNWPTNGYLLANHEILQFTLASATSLTINARAQMGTTAITHAASTPISFLYTGLAFNDFLLPARATASRPANPVPGDFGYNSGANAPEYYNGSVWVSSAQPIVTPQLRLSYSPTIFVPTADQASQTNIFVVPYNGSQIPVLSGGVFTTQTFTTGTVALTASQTTGQIFDVYAFLATGNTLTFGIGPSWSQTALEMN